MKDILQKNATVLRDISKEVPLDQIKSAKIQNILAEMKVSLDSQDDGVAIAAPQIGYSLRIFVVSDKIKDLIKKPKKKAKKVIDEDGEMPEIEEEVALKNTVFINPTIIKMSKEKKMVEEGCLSVRYLYGKVKRSLKTLVEAYDEKGNKFRLGGSGLLAQIFQHEIDHLNGVLFVDKAKYIEEIVPSHIKN